MMFEQCKIVIFNNILFMKKHRKIFRKNSMEIFLNFPEKYEIFRKNFPPHITKHTYIHTNIHTYIHTHIHTFYKYLCLIIRFWSRDLIAKVLVLVSRPGDQGLGLETW